MGLGLLPFTERAGDGSAGPVLVGDEGEELMHVQPSVSIVLGSRPPESPGTLYISSKRVIWLSDRDRDKGYAVDFLSLSLHAVSRDPDAYPLPCIYTQIDVDGDGEDEGSEGSDSECNDGLDFSKITEMRLVPSDPNHLDTLFDIFCECAELNPEPIQVDDAENEWVFGAEQMETDGVTAGEDSVWHFSENAANPIGYANGNHDLARTVLELQINDQRFEDAEEIEREVRDRRTN